MRKFGPGLIVAAAFIGPGTITTASIAGTNYGFMLVWALLFSIITTLILQEMAARLGIVGRLGLAEGLRASLTNPWLKWPVLLLVITAIGLGNAAYQAGNLLGAAVGAEVLTGVSAPLLAALCAMFAIGLLASGAYRLIERILILLVVVMSFVFIAAMLLVPPDLSLIVSHLLPRSLPDGAMLSAIALIGTTVVPYNLFLHAMAVQQTWTANDETATALREARIDLSLSIGLGGLITLAVMATAATALFSGGHHGPVNAASIALQLEPVLGSWAKYCVASGLLAAGLTSAITAPLAASYAVCGALGWSTNMQDRRFKAIWLAVILFGGGFAVVESQPMLAILIAQAANGMLLPIIALALVWVMNQKSLLGEYRNSVLGNCLALLVIIVTLGLGGNKLLGLVLG